MASTDTTSGPRRPPAEAHHGHRDVTGGWLRPAVFGVMDGLVSNGALIAGVAAAGTAPSAIVLTGAAGLVAGAISMATGEYTSVASQAELTREEIEIERRELQRSPAAEEAELAGLYRSRGLPADLARQVAHHLSRDPEQALEIHVREELGIDPDDLPSPWVAAGSSFVAFSLGAFLPLLPYLLGGTTLAPALVLAAGGLFTAGALVARFTGRSWWYSGGRQLLLGAAAFLATFVVGNLVGTGLG